MRVVCIDIEGGHGGSSRSLYHALTRRTGDRIRIEVICRKDNWIREGYEAAGISCVVEPDMPRWTSLERFLPNAYTRAAFRLRSWSRSKDFRKRLLEKLDAADLLHLNHISLADLAVWVKRQRPDLPIVMHIRTLPVATDFAVAQTKRAAAACDAFVFITENERDHFESLLGAVAPGRVIYNPVPRFPSEPDTRPPDGPLRAVCLSNYSPARGLDRLIDIAEAIPAGDRDRFRFVLAGDMDLPRRMPKEIAEKAPGAKTLQEMAEARGVGDCFEFLGHVPDPERVLRTGDVLIKPTRENNPWGRDILEGMAAGLPVISVGTYSNFVETGRTGLLQSRFDASGVADFLMTLDRERALCRQLGRTARDRAEETCNPDLVYSQLTQYWGDVLTSKHEAPPARTRLAAIMPAFTAGGAERVLTTLVDGLPPNEYQTRLFVLNNKGDLKADFSRIGFVHDLATERLRHAFWRLWRVLSLFHVDSVFTSQVHLNIGLLAIARLMPALTVIVREANMPSACLKSGHWPRWYRPLYRWALRRADKVIASSHQMAAEFRTDFAIPESRLAVLYNPVDRDRIRSRAGAPVRSPGEGRRFVAVGRLVRQKGFDRLIEWMKAMPGADRLEILGDGPEKEKLQQQIMEAGLDTRVHLSGFCGNPAPIVAGADALLMPSRWEGMPNAALEALALGTPVIATTESGAIGEIAALAEPGAVTVTDDLPNAMMAVSPSTDRTLRPSLLPDIFVAERAKAAFVEIVQTAVASRQRKGV